MAELRSVPWFRISDTLLDESFCGRNVVETASRSKSRLGYSEIGFWAELRCWFLSYPNTVRSGIELRYRLFRQLVSSAARSDLKLHPAKNAAYPHSSIHKARDGGRAGPTRHRGDPCQLEGGLLTLNLPRLHQCLGPRSCDRQQSWQWLVWSPIRQLLSGRTKVDRLELRKG